MNKVDLVELLKERGIELEIDACGCCNSPFVKVKVDGEQVFDSEGRQACFAFGEVI